MISRPVALTALALVGCGGPSAPVAPSPEPSAGAAPTASATAAPVAEPAPDAGASVKPEEPAPKEDTSGTARERLMRAHFKEVNALRKAVIDGAMSATIGPAETLGNTTALGTIPPKWQPSLDALSAAAKRFGQSPDLPAAAAAIADIGVACGSCHKTGGGPKVQVESPPAADKTVAGQMKRHAWATERMWDGLYGPSDAAWKAGADALSADPFPKEVLAKGGVHARSAASRFTGLVPTMTGKKTPEERAKLYAELLETCSACHMATRGGKK
ncbi:MAG: hypothetical protein HYZ29_29895 [Myxococcales bacterium]|nr:hypothetical protein [Myxococcales bacterium]